MHIIEIAIWNFGTMKLWIIIFYILPYILILS